MELIKVRLNELETFCNSPFYRAFPIKPISPLRVKSYIENPRANANDIVLYMFVENGEIIAFRTILSDFIDKNKPFGWCSGNWVNPKFRGQKLSVKLLHEVLNDWDNLMFTNYAPASEFCYLSTHKFNLLKKRTGLRFYLYPDFREIFGERLPRLKPLLPLLSVAVGGVSFLKSCVFPTKTTRFIEMDNLDEDCRNFLRNFPATCFNRKEAELDWIIKFPWLTSEKYCDFVYPFSFSEIDYSLKIVKIFDNNSFAGFFIYTIINAKMKLIFHYLENDKLNLMVNAVVALARKNKIVYLSILDPSLANRFREKSRCFAFSKRISFHIYSTLDISNEQNLTVFDGDGDNCFT